MSAGFDFSNIFPQKLSFRGAGMIAALGSVLITPWNLFNSPELIHYTLDVLAAFIGPLFGILIADFYFVKKQQVMVDELFNDKSTGQYWYKKGVNPKAVCALIPAVVIGLVFTLVPALQHLAPFNWFIGAFLGASFYRYLSREEVKAIQRAMIKP